MAHKKAGGSSSNGRDSIGKRLGVKRFAGEKILSNPFPPKVDFASFAPNTLYQSALTIASAALENRSPIGIFAAATNCSVENGFEFTAFRTAGSYTLLQFNASNGETSTAVPPALVSTPGKK
jgi:hypothetical protein